jgi:hypothetical protein
MSDFLADPAAWASHWQPEYERVRADRERLLSPPSQLDWLHPLRLLVVHTPEPLHYYALFGPSRGADMVLSIYGEGRYELEYKYTTWVDTETRLSFPRIDLQPLVEQLNAQERSPQRWTCDSIMDTGPLMRLEDASLSKAQRYDHPDRRPIYASSWPANQFLATVQAYYQAAYQDLAPRQRWTWADMKAAQPRA